MKAIQPVMAPDVQSPAGDTAPPAKPRKANKPRKATAKPRKAVVKAKNGAKAKAKGKTKRDQFGFTIGSLKNLAAKMCTAGNGATLAQIKSKLGSPQYNFLLTVEDRGFKINTTQVKGDLGRMVTRYKIVTK